MDEKPNILKNLLLPAAGNKLRLCDLTFDSKIIEIKPRAEQLFDWDDLKDRTNRDNILKTYCDDGESPECFLAIPGGIDPHVHFDTPGFEFREDFEHGSKAAASGGVTTVIDMPCTSVPPVTTAENFRMKLNALEGRSMIDYAFWGGVSGKNFKEADVEENILQLTKCGVAGFKVYFISGMESFTDLTPRQMEFAGRVIEKTGRPMAVHAEDKELVTVREQKYKNANRIDWKAYCDSRDPRAEAVAIDKLISVAQKVNCRIHVVHLSSKLGLDQIKKARSTKLHFTTETCPHYLHFTQKDFENDSIRNFLKTAPPVKCEKDLDALWEGLNDGSIQFVTTDHAGCNPVDEKSSSDFWEVYGGIPGVEHRVPFLLSEGFMKGRLTLEKTVQLLSENAASHFNLENKGNLKPGFDADICLIDLWQSGKIEAANMNSKGKYTPFEALILNAKVIRTYLRGRKIYDLNNPVSDLFGYGKFISVS